ncbi:HNH endonuclease signature motif containing protein [uncultured Pelagimonas sp.]|uniref:HNH endonuclease n=1 Tax=uncultured Pelagimonas sp. TaxID=1618102 RepID=UPI00261805D7|nr:HNH endonuclease signature motif containing protein [uncultured Pelagimonas sp.]
MSEVMKALRGSVDPLENDLARVYDHWQEVKRSQGQRAGLGYEPRDINVSGAVSVISSRVLNASAGFEEIDPDQSYEALVIKYPERFTPDVIAAAQERLKLGASKVQQFRRQDIQFFVKSSAIELFGEPGVRPTAESWVGRDAALPELHKEYSYADEILTKGFRGLVWLHEQEKDGERGRGLTAVVEIGPMQPDRRARVLDAVYFERPVGKELLEAHKDDGTFISSVGTSRHSRIWPISDSDVDSLLSAVREKAHKIAQYENQNPHEPLNLEKIEEATALRQVVLRRYQSAFRQALLSKRPNRCAITGTNELSVLEAAHIIPYAERFADRDKPENGLLLRSDIHKLFDAHLISINPETKAIEVSDRIASPDYQSLRGKTISDDVSSKSLSFHFENFSKPRS